MRNPFDRQAWAQEARERTRGWRVGHRGRDQMFYEEWRGGRWERIEISGEMLMGPAHHVIYFATPGQWSRYPEWAQGRRDEIIARIKSEFRPPEYEYDGDQEGRPPAAPAEPPPAGVPPSPPPPPPRTAAVPRARRPPQGARALLLAVLLLLLLGAGMSWVVIRGVSTGVTRFPIRQAYLRRPVSRQQEPATFWLAIGCYTLVGAGALTLGLLGVREWRRL